MTQQQESSELLDVSGFSDISNISEILDNELDNTIKSIDCDVVPELTLAELETNDDTIIYSDFDETIISSEIQNFIESIGDMLSKSQYILYNLSGEKLYLSKDDVFYESDDNGNRQYYLISNETPLFQNLEMIKQYVLKHI